MAPSAPFEHAMHSQIQQWRHLPHHPRCLWHLDRTNPSLHYMYAPTPTRDLRSITVLPLVATFPIRQSDKSVRDIANQVKIQEGEVPDNLHPHAWFSHHHHQHHHQHINRSIGARFLDPLIGPGDTLIVPTWDFPVSFAMQRPVCLLVSEFCPLPALEAAADSAQGQQGSRLLFFRSSHPPWFSARAH